MEILFMKQWSPYAVGAGIGLLNCLAFLLSDRFIGCSKAFSDGFAAIERIVKGSQVLEKPYYRKFVPQPDWFLMLVIGIPLGAFLSAWLSGELHIAWVPSLWAAHFGPSAARRFCAALAGGFCIGLGARWAGGCTSGHGISGTIQLAVSSWLAVLCFFAGGIITAVLLFKFL
jgi:uncharacterized membrane protein YedE/YeeE